VNIVKNKTKGVSEKTSGLNSKISWSYKNKFLKDFSLAASKETSLICKKLFPKDQLKRTRTNASPSIQKTILGTMILNLDNLSNNLVRYLLLTKNQSKRSARTNIKKTKNNQRGLVFLNPIVPLYKKDQSTKTAGIIIEKIIAAPRRIKK